MSSFHAVWTVSRSLQRMLWEEFERESVVRRIVASEAAIVLSNPTDVQRDPANRLSLWLYQITENEFVKNQPPERSNGNGLRFPPMALNLYYLVTPFAESAEADQLLLGKIMQVLYDNAVVYVRSAGDDVAEELRIVFSRLTLEELTRIWEALREPYRLSVCYLVRVAHVDSARLTGEARVIDRIADLDDAPPVTAGGGA